MKAKTKALIASYARSVLGAASALYLAGVTDPLDLLWSLVGALAPVGIRYINPNDPSFGNTPKAEEIDKALHNVKPIKAPIKKTAKK